MNYSKKPLKESAEENSAPEILIYLQQPDLPLPLPLQQEQSQGHCFLEQHPKRCLMLISPARPTTEYTMRLITVVLPLNNQATKSN